MSLTGHLRILVAAAAVAVLALCGGFLLLGRGQSASSAAVGEIKPLHPVKKHVRAAAARKLVRRASKPRRRAVVDGMPAALAQALRSHPVVVVSLYAPRSGLDELAKNEARQGAALAGAGFAALNVADEHVVSALASLVTEAPTPADRVPDGPAVLVFQRPKSLFIRFNGFVDRDTVAQAVANAAASAR